MQTLTEMILEWVDQTGPKTWKEIHSFLLIKRGLDPDDRDNRGRYSSYFSGRNCITNATHHDGRSLIKFEGKYHLLPF